MENIISILCVTFIIALLVYWVMPIKKMKAVHEALKTLLQVLPISKTIEVILGRGSVSKKE